MSCHNKPEPSSSNFSVVSLVRYVDTHHFLPLVFASITFPRTCAQHTHIVLLLPALVTSGISQILKQPIRSMSKRRSFVLTLAPTILFSGILDLTAAFSPPGPRTSPPGPRLGDTERSYGSNVDTDFAVTVNSPTLGFDSLVQLTSDHRPNKPKRRKHEVMMRPKSLSSSFSKTDSSSKKEKFPQLLSREEEAHLSNCIHNLRSAIRVRDDLVANHPNPEDSEFPWHPSETEWAVACGMSVMQLRRVMSEGQEARTKLVDANGGLVNSIAKKHFYSVKQANQAGGGLGSILTLQDMIQEGSLGLMKAAERFEPERGNRFSTYATYWIRQRILRSISEYSRTIRLPAHGE